MHKPELNKKGKKLLSPFEDKIIMGINSIMSVFILILMFLLVIFIGHQIYALYAETLNGHFTKIVHGIVYVTVLLKAYRILIFYLKTFHVSIKYIIEICIIAPAIEVIFELKNLELHTAIFLGIFCITNLFIYIKFYQRIKQIDEEIESSIREAQK